MDSDITYLSIIIVIYLPISGYWFVVFVTRIANSRRYMKATERIIKFDNSDYISQQYNYNYQTEVCKYSMLICINLMEFSGAALSYILLLVGKLIPILKSNNIYKEELERCASINNSLILNFQFGGSSFVLLTILRALSEFAEMMALVLMTSLMSYLMSRMKKSDHMNIRRYICIICLIGVAFVITSCYAFLTALRHLAILVIFTYNYILFLIYVKRFKQSLLQAARERLVQYGSNRIEMKQCKYFSYCMNCFCFGLTFLTVATYLDLTTRIMISLIFFGRCVFPTVFMPPLISLESFNEQDILKLFSIFNDIPEIAMLLTCMGVFIAAFPLVFITIGRWMRSVARKIRRESPMQHRYQVFSAHDEGMQQFASSE